MFKQITTLRVAAAAVILLGVASCGNKKTADENIDTTPVTDTPVVEDTVPLDTLPALDSAIAEAVDSIDDNAKPADDGYVTTPSGLKYKILRKGTGATPTASSLVTVNYEGRFTNGTVFESSYQGGKPIDFGVGGVIPGWTEGLQLMQEGAEYEFYIPYNLAYGERGAGPIPPNSDLIFKVELLKVK